MALLPAHANARIDAAKLSGYCLSASHLRGRHKARVFAEALGIGQTDAEWLRLAISGGLVENDAVLQERDEYGQRWRVDMMLTRQNRRAVVRTIWILREGETVPRFVTCWVL
jgi:hypothetical protein